MLVSGDAHCSCVTADRNSTAVSAAARGGRKKLVPAAQACGPTNIWLAKREGRGGWSQPSAPGTTALRLAWTGEACSLQTEAAERENRRDEGKMRS